MRIASLIACCCLLFSGLIQAQEVERLPFLEPADTFHAPRFYTVAAIGTGIYTGSLIGLYQSWYSEYPQSNFHFFNDNAEWQQVDKIGHITSAYIFGKYGHHGARWTGMSQKNAIWSGIALSTVLQLTIEVLDGFSSEWGFSPGDLGSNLIGTGIFASQEWLWSEQRIQMKISGQPNAYPDFAVRSINNPTIATSLEERANSLYGATFPEQFFKDYNAQNNWASVNIWSFLPEREKSSFPRWLNVSFGYGAGNMYGGYRNEWKDEFGNIFVLDKVQFPRYRRYLLSLDVDFSKIRTKSRFWKTAFQVINWIKVPAPALEYNSLGKWNFHPIFW